MQGSSYASCYFWKRESWKEAGTRQEVHALLDQPQGPEPKCNLANRQKDNHYFKDGVRSSRLEETILKQHDVNLERVNDEPVWDQQEVC